MKKLVSKEVFKSNYQIAADALTQAREDHYDGVHTIFRMAACVPIPGKINSNEIYNRVDQLLVELASLDVRANRIYIHNEMLEIDFYPRRSLIVMNKSQYAGLMLDFAYFLERSGIEDIRIQSGMYCDDPEDKIPSTLGYLVNYFPEFNSACFGAYEYEEIDMIDIRLHLDEVEEVA